MKSKFQKPNSVYVVDIETEQIPDRKQKGKSSEVLADLKIAIVGLMKFFLKDGTYKFHSYQIYEAAQIKDCESELLKCEGIILGHNIFEFDFRVLKKHINIENIIHKTVDTLHFLRQKHDNPWLGGLNLNQLGISNFGKGKTKMKDTIYKLWLSGKREAVIKYNKNDLKITFALWGKLVEKRKIQTVIRRDGKPSKYSIIVNNTDMQLLLGKMPTTYRKWEEMDFSSELEDRKDIDEMMDDVVGEDLPEYDKTFQLVSCDGCKTWTLFYNIMNSGHADFEEVRCPKCKNIIGNFRVDVSMIELKRFPKNPTRKQIDVVIEDFKSSPHRFYK